MNKINKFNKILLAIVVVALAGGFINVSKADAWYNASWSYRIKITVDYTKVPSNQTNFPVYVDLANLPTGFHTNVNQTDARDIRITKADGATELPREVVFYTAASNTGELYFKADSLSSTVNTDFYIYYGNPSATEPAANSTYGKNNVWDSSFKGVWHLPNGSSLTATDSTSIGDNGNITGSTPTAGKIDGAANFSGTGQYIDLGTTNNTILSPLTVSAWVKPTSLAADQQIFAAGYNGTSTQYQLQTTGTTGHIAWEVYNSGTETGITSTSSSVGVLSTSAWNYVVGVYDGTRWILYLNGGQDKSVTATGPVSTSQKLFIGAVSNSGTPVQLWGGIIDEVRLSNATRQPNWITTEYSNQNSPSTFYTTGIEEASAPDITTGLVGYYNMDDGTGIYANDSSGNVNTGTLLGSTLPTWVVGKFGNSLSFNGTTAYVSVADSASLRGMSQLTLSAWVNKSTKDIKVFGKWNGGNNYILRETAGQIQFYTGTTNGVIGGNTGLVGSTGWHFYVVTYDGTTMKAYKDGVVGGTTYNQTGSISNTPGSNLIIGAEYDISLPQDGLIDDLHIYNRALSSAEVSALYSWVPASAPTTVSTSTQANLSSYYVTLKGAANPNGIATTGHFRVYNYNPGNCNSDIDGAGIMRFPVGNASFPDLILGSGTSVVTDPTFSYTIPFNSNNYLTPNTTYYYCAYAVNILNSTTGSTSGGSSGVVSFTTTDGPTNPCDAPISGDMTVPAGASCNFSNSFNGVDSAGGGSNTARLYGSSGSVMTINPGVKVAAGGFWPNGGALYIGAGGMFFPGSHVYVHDADGDGVLDDNLTYTGRTSPAGYVTRPSFVSNATNSASLNYASKLSATSVFDCNPSSTYVYRYVQNLVKDADQDGYKTADAAGVQCVGAKATFNGRDYYNDGSGPN